MNKYYYYCSVLTFFNIIENKSIYLSDPLKMNDSDELVWVMKLLEKTDMEFVKKDYPELASVAETIIPRLRKFISEEGQDNMYICCFSQKKDLLSQWRGYGDDGKGVSIGFDLDKMINRNHRLEKQKVIYTDKLDESEVIEILDDISAMEIYSRYTTNKNKKFVDFCSRMMLRYKNSAFMEEDEVRLMYSRDIQFYEDGGIFDGVEDVDSLKPKFRMIGTSDFIEYVELGMESDDFTDICLGPKCKLRECDVKRFLEDKLKRDINIYVSGATYR